MKSIQQDCDPRVIRLAELLAIMLPHAIGIVEGFRQADIEYRWQGRVKGDSEYYAWRFGYTEDFNVVWAAMLESKCLVRDEAKGFLLACGNWKGTKRFRRLNRIRAAGGEPTKAMRQVVMHRDSYSCVRCASTKDLTLDHIVPIAFDGKTEITNLQVLCRRCNSSKRDT